MVGDRACPNHGSIIHVRLVIDPFVMAIVFWGVMDQDQDSAWKIRRLFFKLGVESSPLVGERFRILAGPKKEPKMQRERNRSANADKEFSRPQVVPVPEPQVPDALDDDQELDAGPGSGILRPPPHLE